MPYLFDGLGSVVAVTDASGTVTNSYTYDPFGVTTETKAPGTNTFNPWRYTSQYQDTSTGLYKVGRGTTSPNSRPPVRTPGLRRSSVAKSTYLGDRHG